ncbi:MAG TPA: hypothetical protein PLP34_07520 [Chitinophagaceae bacterium]|nr:hypothetical protein [Chitinophagaceae bacterium]HNF72244.1 hypothetical protein [Chitinophagaceae bacterium]
MKKLILSLSLCILCTTSLLAQSTSGDASNKKKKITMTTGVESNLLQFAFISPSSLDQCLWPRYTYFFNLATDFNFEVNKHFKPFAGLSLKNIGLIINTNDSVKSKHRVYTLGVPLGLKFFLLKKEKLMIKVGGDVSVAIDYKWKNYVNNTKKKDHEFFSDKTSLLFTSAFMGFSYSGVSISANYYFNNFFHSDLNPAPIEAHLLTIGLGLNLDQDAFKKKSKKENTNTSL